MAAQTSVMEMQITRVDQEGIPLFVMVFLGIFAVIAALMLFKFFRRAPRLSLAPAETATVGLGLAPEAERHLKEQERLVVEILRAKHGMCSQAALRNATSYSKAKLSRLLKELEERKILEKQKDGKRNIVVLKG